MAEEHAPELTVVVGDLTTQQVDVVVNAANGRLLGGGGVDGALHRAAGPELLEACRKVRATTHPDGLPAGEAVATGAGRLPATWVAHTVGPNRHAGETDPALLRASFASSLRVAAGLLAETVAFPAVGAGAYGWEMATVAREAVRGVREVIAAGEAPGVREVRFVVVGEAAAGHFSQALAADPR